MRHVGGHTSKVQCCTVDQTEENNVIVYKPLWTVCDSKVWGLAWLPRCQWTAWLLSTKQLYCPNYVLSQVQLP